MHPPNYQPYDPAHGYYLPAGSQPPPHHQPSVPPAAASRPSCNSIRNHPPSDEHAHNNSLPGYPPSNGNGNPYHSNNSWQSFGRGLPQPQTSQQYHHNSLHPYRPPSNGHPYNPNYNYHPNYNNTYGFPQPQGAYSRLMDHHRHHQHQQPLPRSGRAPPPLPPSLPRYDHGFVGGSSGSSNHNADEQGAPTLQELISQLPPQLRAEDPTKCKNGCGEERMAKRKICSTCNKKQMRDYHAKKRKREEEASKRALGPEIKCKKCKVNTDLVHGKLCRACNLERKRQDDKRRRGQIKILTEENQRLREEVQQLREEANPPKCKECNEQLTDLAQGDFCPTCRMEHKRIAEKKLAEDHGLILIRETIATEKLRTIFSEAGDIKIKRTGKQEGATGGFQQSNDVGRLEVTRSAKNNESNKSNLEDHDFSRDYFVDKDSAARIMESKRLYAKPRETWGTTAGLTPSTFTPLSNADTRVSLSKAHPFNVALKEIQADYRQRVMNNPILGGAVEESGEHDSLLAAGEQHPSKKEPKTRIFKVHIDKKNFRTTALCSVGGVSYNKYFLPGDSEDFYYDDTVGDLDKYEAFKAGIDDPDERKEVEQGEKDMQAWVKEHYPERTRIVVFRMMDGNGSIFNAHVIPHAAVVPGEQARCMLVGHCLVLEGTTFDRKDCHYTSIRESLENVMALPKPHHNP